MTNNNLNTIYYFFAYQLVKHEHSTQLTLYAVTDSVSDPAITNFTWEIGQNLSIATIINEIRSFKTDVQYLFIEPEVVKISDELFFIKLVSSLQASRERCDCIEFLPSARKLLAFFYGVDILDKKNIISDMQLLTNLAAVKDVYLSNASYIHTIPSKRNVITGIAS